MVSASHRPFQPATCWMALPPLLLTPLGCLLPWHFSHPLLAYPILSVSYK